MKTTLLTLALATGPALLCAAENLETMVVTGYPTTLADAPASVDLITREEIENSSATDVADLLRFHSGLEIGRNGGPGQTTSLFIRGTESDHNLVMIDGVPVNSGSVGSAALQNIDPRLIDHIEIYKGPRATLWGSGAIGGVINIVTRRGTTLGTDWGGMIEGGEENSWRAAARVSHDSAQLHLAADLAYQRTDGFPPLAASNLDRGYRNTSFSLSAGWDTGIHEFLASHWQASGNNEYLDYFGNPLDQDFLDSRSSLGWTAAFTDRWTSRLELAQVKDHIDQNQSDGSVHTNRTQLEWENQLRLFSDDRLVLGYRYSRESVEAVGGFSPYDSTTRIHEAWLQYELQRGPHHLIAGFRYLDHEDAGHKPTWSLNYGLRLSPATSLWANVATAFRVPSANERFGFGGNPDLDPESSTGYELGLRHQLAPSQRLSATLYRTDLENMIQWVMVTAPWYGYNQNVAKARIEGLELGYDLNLGDLTLHLGGNWQNPVDRTSGDQLLRRAHYSLAARAGYDLGRWHLGADLLHSGPRKDFGGITLDRYTLVNLNLSYRLAPEWQIFGRLENAFDEDYELASGYNTAGRTAWLGVRYR